MPNRNEPKYLQKNYFGIEELVNHRRMWEIVLKLSKKALTKKRIQICSKHFTANNFFPPGKLLYLLLLVSIIIISYYSYNI